MRLKSGPLNTFLQGQAHYGKGRLDASTEDALWSAGPFFPRALADVAGAN